MTEYSDRNMWFIVWAVVITAVLHFIVAVWLELRTFFIMAALTFWFIVIYLNYRKYPQILQTWGFRKKNFGKSFLFLLPFMLAGIIGILAYAIIIRGTVINWHILPIMGMYPFWGVIQQFIVAGLVAGNVRKLSKGKFSDQHIMLIISLLFGLLHFPGIPLMVYVFVMEYILLTAYFRYNNLWTLGLFHGWVSGLFLFYVSNRDLWNELMSAFH